MKAAVMKELADGIVNAFRRHVAETRESLMGRIHAGESVTADLRRDVEALQMKLDIAESAIAELQQRLQLKRVA